MSTKEEPGPFDGMARAEPDEPVFTLRAHDALAPGLVHEWVRQRREVIGRADYPEEKRELELIQCREAEEIAWSMADWRNGSRPVEEAATDKLSPNYSGNTSSVEEIAAKRRYDVTKGAVATLHNALAEITDAANNLSEFGHEGERAVILAAAERLKAVAAHIAPKRASYSTVDPEPEPFIVPTAEGMDAALRLCRAQFTFYAGSHREKGTPDGDRKAAVNEDMARMIDRALGSVCADPA